MLERFFAYSSPEGLGFSVGAGLTSYDQRILIRQNADFYMRAFGMVNTTSAVAGRMRRADASWFTGPDFLHLTGFTNTAGAARPTPIRPQLRYPQSGAFVFDLRDLGGAGDPSIYPVLLGVERYPDNAIPPPALPVSYIEEPYSISATVNISGVGAQVLDQTIKCQTGDPFVVRTLRWKNDDVVGAAPLLLQIRIRDEYSRMFMQNWVPMRSLFAGPDDAQPYPGIVFPEWVIPAYGSYTFDVFSPTEAGPFTIELAFGGARLLAVNSQ
jgi:hypothetical protein